MEESRLLLHGIPSALVAAGVGGFLMVAATGGTVSAGWAALWLLAHLGVLLLRFWHVHRFTDVTADTELPGRGVLLLGIFATGLTWGAAGVLFYPDADAVRQTLLGLLLVAVVGGGISLHVASPAATTLFAAPVLLPISLQFLLHQGSTNRPLGFAGLLLLVVVLLATRRFSQAFAENLRLRLEVERRSRQLSESRHKLDQHIEQTPMGVVEFDRNFKIVGWNPAAERIFGYTREQALQLYGKDLLYEEDVPSMQPVMDDLLNGKGGGLTINRNRRSDGASIQCEWLNTPLMGPDGRLIGVSSLVQDVTEKRRTQAVLAASEEQFRYLVERSLAGVYVINNGVFTYVNPMFARIFGYRTDEIIDHKQVGDLVAPEDRETVLANVRRRIGGEIDSIRYQFRGQRKDGSPVDVEVIGSRGTIDGEPVIFGTLLDVTEALQARNRIERLANFDPLTDLPNRQSVSGQADAMITTAHADGTSLNCLYIDLDRFKDVNDTLGHDIGDELLNEAAQRMRRCLREQDVLARMGGDEFTVLMPQADAQAAAQVGRRIIETLSKPFSIKGKLVRAGASVGAARMEPEIRDFNALWKRADIAMYRAKRTRGTFAFFDASQEAELEMRVRLETDLEAAIGGDQLYLHYQPRRHLGSGACTSVEALLRWQHPLLGNIPPGEFVPVAEAGGLIHRLGNWVLREACRQVRSWHEQGRELHVAVNLSMVELQQSGILDRTLATLRDDLGVSPTWLEFEITESAAMENPEFTVEAVSRFRELGVSISIDDFGTGYSSLNYLKRIPAHFLKIDRSFVSGVAGGDEEGLVDRDIVRAVVALARSLGMQTIAEGVELAEESDFLREIGCDYIQGFLVSRPLPPAELLDWLDAQA